MGAVIAALAIGALVCGVIGWFVGKAPWSSDGGARGFALGFLLGPIGILVDAVLRAGDQAAPASRPQREWRASAAPMSSADLVARGFAPRPKPSASQKSQTTGMLSEIQAQDLQPLDEMIRDGRFVTIRSVDIADNEVRIALGSGANVVLQLDESVKVHRHSVTG